MIEPEDVIFEASGEEGSDWKDFWVSDFTGKSPDYNHPKGKGPVRIYLTISGLSDDNAPMRNWGIQSIESGMPELKKQLEKLIK